MGTVIHERQSSRVLYAGFDGLAHHQNFMYNSKTNYTDDDKLNDVAVALAVANPADEKVNDLAQRLSAFCYQPDGLLRKRDLDAFDTDFSPKLARTQGVGTKQGPGS